jgi:dethiobiotin synthetase
VSLFITGTDTGVGKTHTTIQLLRLLRASGTRCAGMKPIVATQSFCSPPAAEA